MKAVDIHKQAGKLLFKRKNRSAEENASHDMNALHRTRYSHNNSKQALQLQLNDVTDYNETVQLAMKIQHC